MYRFVHITKSEANKIFEVFCLWQCQLFFLFITYNGFIFDEKGVFQLRFNSRLFGLHVFFAFFRK